MLLALGRRMRGLCLVLGLLDDLLPTRFVRLLLQLRGCGILGTDFFFVGPVEGFVFLEHVFHDGLLLRVFAAVLNECVVRVVDHIFHVEHVAYGLQHVLLALARYVIDEWLVAECESLGHSCKYHLYADDQALR